MNEAQEFARLVLLILCVLPGVAICVANAGEDPGLSEANAGRFLAGLAVMFLGLAAWLVALS